jgi:L-talarate/galactarate dehydratase
MVDATETWSVDRAMRTGRALQQTGVVWIEDPVRHTDIVGMARLSAALDVPLATGGHLYQIADYTARRPNGSSRRRPESSRR